MIKEIIIGLIVAFATFILTYAYMKVKFYSILKEAKKTSLNQSRAVLKGQINEQIAPLIKDFPYKYSEVRFVGKPTDFVVFKGLDEKNVEEIVFLEVKTANSTLNKTERSVKKCVDEKNVRFEEYRIK
ncbi:MAG: Holliday junction resolvase-like protein [Candidatus Woesearchaeota archaeon]